ncbi:hypothetical protein SPONN_553 [uncultured Candidatus Thioglobus sp.]|nr:hypothetical protein SPONN_553 [uncultured Candidatus Thioglobus sp.]
MQKDAKAVPLLSAAYFGVSRKKYTLFKFTCYNVTNKFKKK